MTALAALTVVASLTACDSTANGAAPVITVSPVAGRYDTPLSIEVTGLAPRETVTLGATTQSATGLTYRSSATYLSDGRGSLDLAGTAPASGSYSGAHAQGLLWSMACVGCHTFLVPPAAGYIVSLTVTVNGSVVATTRFSRRLADPGVIEEDERPAAVGFYGDYFRPAATGAPRPAVLLFGGSEGGLDLDAEASLLASDGYPALDLAYFDEPGLPQKLASIPLEYFAGALAWLARQPGADPSRIVVQGASRGSEAALLLGVEFPQMVHGVIALVPNDAALCDPQCDGPAWTLHGAPVPYTSEFDEPAPTDNRDALIAAERIRGPILMDCGGRDQVWHSCAFAAAIQARLSTFAYSHTLLSYPDADHYVSSPMPDFPDGQDQPDALARIDQWPRMLDLISAA